MHGSRLSRCGFALWLLWLSQGASCARPTATERPAQPAREEPQKSARPAPAVDTQPLSASEPPEPVLLVTDPEVCEALEARRLGLAALISSRADELGAERSERVEHVDNATLASDSRYRSLVDTLTRDLAAAAAADPRAGVGVRGNPHRLFDVRWLRASTAHFELVAVMNRFDRAHAIGGCGELRLVYRLAYQTRVGDAEVASRLPMTLSLELLVPDDGAECRAAAARWLPPRSVEGSALADWLVSAQGPLEPSRVRAGLGAHRLAVNVQQVRWPSTVRPDLGGHAEYLMRSFTLTADGQRYAPAPLENTPDVARLARDPALRAELLSFLAEPASLQAVARGTLLLPERFLAKSALSVTPRGLARSANRPLRALFSRQDLAGLDLTLAPGIATPDALVRRLDGLGCPSCHQARSIAGFHMLGDDPEHAPAGNALAQGGSPHLHDDLRRRRALLIAALAGEPRDYAQPFPERGAYAGYGAHCSLGKDQSFAEWTCDDGLLCGAYDADRDEPVGQCLPAVSSSAGDPCELGALDPRRDRVPRATLGVCGERAVCNRNAVGFPGGMCTESCGALSEGSTCGAIAVLDPFNACVARGKPFLECLAHNTRPAGLRACSVERPCRDDYICARAQDGGACIPPYFVFQLRVDGHP